MSNKIGSSLGIAIGAALVGSLSLSQLAAASPAFQVNDLASGYMLAHVGGHVNLATLDTDGDGTVSLAEAKAGGFSEEAFNKYDKNGDGVLDTNELKTAQAVMDKNHPEKKGAEGSCGGDKKATAKGAEGSCGGDKKAATKAAEGSCGGHKDGEGSCGAMRG